MKIFTLLHKSNNEGTRIPVLKSRITSTKPLLNHYCVLIVALLLLLGGFSTRAYAGKTFYAQCRVESRPTVGGKVSVWRSLQEDDTYAFVTKTSDQTGTNSEYQAGINPSSTKVGGFYGYQKANTGYTFSGWSTDPSATSGTNNPKDHKYN